MLGIPMLNISPWYYLPPFLFYTPPDDIFLFSMIQNGVAAPAARGREGKRFRGHPCNHAGDPTPFFIPSLFVKNHAAVGKEKKKLRALP